MNRNLPSRVQSLLCRSTRIVQPALIEKLCRAVWTSGPHQRRDGVDYKANVLYISRFFEAMPQGFHERIIAPYVARDHHRPAEKLRCGEGRSKCAVIESQPMDKHDCT